MPEKKCPICGVGLWEMPPDASVAELESYEHSAECCRDILAGDLAQRDERIKALEDDVDMRRKQVKKLNHLRMDETKQLAQAQAEIERLRNKIQLLQALATDPCDPKNACKQIVFESVKPPEAQK